MKNPSTVELLAPGEEGTRPRGVSQPPLQTVAFTPVFVQDEQIGSLAELALPLHGLITNAGRHPKSGPVADDA